MPTVPEPPRARRRALAPATSAGDPDRRAAPGGAPGVLAALVAVLAAGFLLVIHVGPSSAEGPGAHPPRPDPARGLVGLGLSAADQAGDCAGFAFEVETPGGAIACSHGPDPGPIGIDVRTPPSLERRTTGEVALAGDATVPCVGNGSAGMRVQAIYAYVQGGTSRYSVVAPLIRGWAGEIDDVVRISAGQTAGQRHVRWVHDDDCVVSVATAALSSGAAVNLGQMMGDLDRLGFDRPDRRYLVWFDGADAVCGVAVNIADDSPGQDNQNNGVTTGIVHFGRVDEACWGRDAPETLVEAHELMHTLGAVQFSSPNSSSVEVFEGAWDIYGHCIDEYETMCYADGSPKSLVVRCPASNERYLDCRHDDYFHTGPPSGSYLATHWNSAMSSFLARVDPVAGFLDVSSSPFRGDIAWIAAAGITRGCSADGERFCPTSPVSREQMASFLDRSLALPTTSRDFFTDDETSVHEASINRLAAAAITGGCASGRFCPRLTVTREQMASFLARALHLPATTRDFFADDETSIHEGDINRLAASGITGGCGSGRFCPRATVTREQMAAFLRRAFD
jgi:hypothetical protein